MTDMVSSLRRRAASDDGFTLVELLVVILIVGILAAIAVPSFLDQRTKAQDAEAKVLVVAAQKALQIYHGERDTYAGAGSAELSAIERAVGRAINLTVVGDASTYALSVDSVAGANGGGRFTVERRAGDVIVRSCDNAGRGGCPASGRW